MASFYNNYYKYYRRPYPFNNISNLPNNSSSFSSEDNFNSTNNSNEETSNKEKQASRYHSFGPINFKNPFFNDIEEPVFEILGIQLFLDDIIILGLLFFLYQEGVQDEMLFISLILLLLS